MQRLSENWRDWPLQAKQKMLQRLQATQTPQGKMAPAVMKPRRTLLEWVRENRPYLAPGRLFDLNSHPYLEGPYTDGAQEQVFTKAGQLGISELLISWVL